MALYNDRVFAFERMQAMDAALDDADSDTIAAFCADDDRHHLAQLELQYFEKHSEFLYLHPLLTDTATESLLEILRKANPAEFTKQMINAQKSVDRYTSRINLKKYKDEKELADWSALISAYAKKIEMMQALISK